jgi:hypothetical protein
MILVDILGLSKGSWGCRCDISKLQGCQRIHGAKDQHEALAKLRYGKVRARECLGKARFDPFKAKLLLLLQH